jgi:hypothetical protein
MRPYRAVSLLMSAALLTGVLACTTEDSPPGPPRADAQPPPATAYDAVLAKVKADGTVDRATALSAFALAIGPVPGVTPPAGPRGPIPSGTAAVLWTFAHWSGLTAGQKAAVRAALTGVDGTNKPASLRRVAAPKGPDVDCQKADSPDAAALRPVLDEVIAQIGAKLGRQLRFPVFLTMNTTQLEDHPDGTPTLMYTFPCTNGVNDAEARANQCTIHVNPVAMGAQYSDANRRSFLTHEAMHCFVIDGFAAHDALPAWLQEGIPMWVQTTLHGADPIAQKHWFTYLKLDRRSLFRRSYDAIGFFVQLANSGVDVWSRIDVMIKEYLRGGNDAAFKAGQPGADFLRSWAPGHARGARPGPAWDITGNGIPAYRPAAKAASGASVKVSAPKAGVDLVTLALPADSVVSVAGGAAARGLLGLADGDHPVEELLGKSFCTRAGGCSCPDSSPGAGTDLPTLAAGDGWLGVTGGLKAASVTLTVSPFDGFCDKPPQCVVGDWTHTNADIRAGSGETAMHETGGAGMLMTIGADGATRINFTPMKPVKFTVATGLAGTLRYRGTVDYRLGLPPAGATEGQLRYLGGDLSKLTVTARVTSPFDLTVFENESVLGLAAGVGGLSVDGQPLASDHRFTCSATTLVLKTADGTVKGTWTFRRS